MTIRSRWFALILGAAAFTTLAAVSPSAPAQTPDSTKSTAPVKKKADPSRRVPSYFGQIGLSPEQRESIYKIRRSHQDKIAALKKQIDQIEDGMMDECEGVLNDTQKKLLANLRKAAAEGPKSVDSPKVSTSAGTTKTAK